MGPFRPTSHGGRAGAIANVRSLDGAVGLDARSAAGAVSNNNTSCGGRIASSEYFLIIVVDARRVAGFARTRGMD